jgi:predicted small secreted protein
MNPILIFKINRKAAQPRNFSRLAGCAAVSLLFLSIAAPSCATARGFGHDVERTGETIQGAASRR